MNKIKHGRLNQDVHRLLTELCRELKDPRIQGGFFTITRVEVTEDLAYAKVYVSILGDKTDELFKALNKASGFLRTELSSRMKIRKSPQLRFLIDDGAAYAEKINNILSDMNRGQKEES